MKKIAVVMICALGALLAATAPAALAHGKRSGCKRHRGHHRHAHCVRHGKRGPLATMAGGNHKGVKAGSSTPPPIHCNLYAAPSGSDSNGDGSIGNPYQSLVKLDDSLAPGQTGCLRAGTYGGTHTLSDLTNDGSSGSRITIASYPGETATVVGWVSIDASYTTLSHLKIDGSNNFFTGHASDGTGCPNDTSQALGIQGHNDVLEYDDYYQSVASMRGVGIGVGFGGGGDDTIIRFDKIHDVGQCQAYDHLIYLSHGNNVQIYDNWMWNDAHGRGVQIYPAATNARVFDNVIDRAGEGFVIGDEQGETVSGNKIYNNVVSNSVGLPWEGIPGQAIHDLYGGSPGTGNSFHDNLVYDNPGGVGPLTAVQSYGNSIGNPKFVDAGAHNYQVRSGSPVGGWSLWDGSGAP